PELGVLVLEGPGLSARLHPVPADLLVLALHHVRAHAERLAEDAVDAGLLAYLAQRTLAPVLAALELALRKRPVVVPRPVNDEDFAVLYDDSPGCADRGHRDVVIPPLAERRAAYCRPPAARRSVMGMFRAVFAKRTWLETAYLLVDLPVGIVGFTVVVTGLSLGLGMLITLIGIPILTLTLLACR